MHAISGENTDVLLLQMMMMTTTTMMAQNMRRVGDL